MKNQETNYRRTINKVNEVFKLAIALSLLGGMIYGFYALMIAPTLGESSRTPYEIHSHGAQVEVAMLCNDHGRGNDCRQEAYIAFQYCYGETKNAKQCQDDVVLATAIRLRKEDAR